MPWAIGKKFPTAGSEQNAEFEAQREQIVALNFVPFWCPYKFLFNRNTDSMGKTLVARESRMGMCNILHIHILENTL